MGDMYLQDLTNAKEVVLDMKRKVRASDELRGLRPMTTSSGGNSGRAAGAISISNAVGAAFTNRRVLEPVEARLMMSVGALLLAFAALLAKFLRALLYPVLVIFIWLGVQRTISATPSRSGLRIMRDADRSRFGI
jgi:cardiolipin synthase A/B